MYIFGCIFLSWLFVTRATPIFRTPLPRLWLYRKCCWATAHIYAAGIYIYRSNKLAKINILYLSKVNCVQTRDEIFCVPVFFVVMLLIWSELISIIYTYCIVYGGKNIPGVVYTVWAWSELHFEWIFNCCKSSVVSFLYFSFLDMRFTLFEWIIDCIWSRFTCRLATINIFVF